MLRLLSHATPWELLWGRMWRVWGVFAFGWYFPKEASLVWGPKGLWFPVSLPEWNVTWTPSHHQALPSNYFRTREDNLSLPCLLGASTQDHALTSCFFMATQKPHCGQRSVWRMECTLAFLSRRADHGSCHSTQQGMLFIDLK